MYIILDFCEMEESSYVRQVFSMLQRNIIIKARVKKQMITEFLWPVLFIIILALIRYLAKVSTVSGNAVPEFPVINITADKMVGEILVVPDNYSSYLQKATKECLKNSTFYTKGFHSEMEAETYYRLSSGEKVIAAVVFSSKYNYTIRTSFISSPSPDDLLNNIDDCRPDSYRCPTQLYKNSGFLAIQWALNCAALLERNLTVPDIEIQQMPKASFLPDSKFIRQFAPVYYVYIYSFFLQFLVVGLVTEKRTKLKEMLRIMGLKDSAFWLSWAMLYFTIIVVVTVVAVTFAHLTDFFRPPSNLLIFFIMLCLYGFSIINLAFLMTPFLNNPNVAGPVAVLASTAVSSLFVIISVTTKYDENGTPQSAIPVPVQWLLCLLSPTALSIAIERAIYLDVAQIGVTWNSLHLGEFPLYAPIVMLGFDSVLYFLLAIYLDKVVPGQLGQALHPCYCCKASYWKGIQISDSKMDALLDKFYHNNINTCPYIEPVPDEMVHYSKLRLLDIKKTYKYGSQIVEAVKGITLDIYENEITCILGHNGAGKTTLMNMLTGLTTPTHGTALMYGLDIRDPSHMEKIRKMTGLCPQYDVLVDNMTCREHLVLYASLKGFKTEDVPEEVNKILKEVDLLDQADCYSKNLSGGQKRKLSVGIAFIGEPKIIFLDEPSAGMDPRSRRHLWSLLKNKKHGRIILLTTHFMDEADILADRKAIVSKGRLKCCGSSLYLKTKFGIGYNLNLVVDRRSYKREDVEMMVMTFVPGAEMSHIHGMEVCFSLPFQQSHRFSDLFTKLEEPCYERSKMKRASLLGIQSYGISMTTLEEVFLHLADIADEEETELKNITAMSHGSHRSVAQAKRPLSAARSQIKSCLPKLHTVLEESDKSLKPSKFQIFKAVTKIRMFISLRDKMAMFSRIILPVILILIAAVILKSAHIEYNPPETYINFDTRGVFHNFRSQYAIMNNSVETSDFELLITKHTNITGRKILALSNLTSHIPYQFGLYIPSNSSVRMLYNDTWVHSLPYLLNLLANTLLKRSTTESDLIMTASKPLRSLHPRYVFNSAIFTFSIMIGFALIFLPTSFAQAAINDRVCKAKCQLRIAGLPNDLYWLSIMALDWVQFMMIGLFLLISFFIFQVRSMIELGAILCTLLFLLLYIPVYTLALYVMSYGFNVPYSSQGLIQTLCILLNISFAVPVAMLAISENDQHCVIGDYLHLVFTFVNPFYTASGYFLFLLKYDVKQSFTQQSSEPITYVLSYFYWENHLLPVFLAALVWIPILIGLLHMLDENKYGKKFLSKMSWKQDGSTAKTTPQILIDEDEDVAIERNKVLNCANRANRASSSTEPVLIVQNLHKEFKKPSAKSADQKMVAVKNLTFQVMPGEVLGILGPNGAGKSTTMKMLTAEVTPDSGVVLTGSTDIHKDLPEALSKMGYCPQFDALWPDITIREHLRVYSVIRGYHPQFVDRIVQYFLALLKLEEHADKLTRMLSGGTKRKLSFAMAMLGEPQIVLLDEPSTGMDPQSKRLFWDAIAHCFEGSNRGAILTTHYMEEADALCHRIGIMINGQLECLGTSQHLKTRFGNGYLLEVKIASMKESSITAEIEKLHTFILQYFPNAHILEQFGPRVAYKVAASDVLSLGKSFEILEKGKREINIGEYNFSQATLEQVFLEFTKYQVEEQNTVTEQNERCQDIAQTRKVSALQSKVNSSMEITIAVDKEELKLIEKKLQAAVEKYIDEVKTKAVGERPEPQEETLSIDSASQCASEKQDASYIHKQFPGSSSTTECAKNCGRSLLKPIARHNYTKRDGSTVQFEKNMAGSFFTEIDANAKQNAINEQEMEEQRELTSVSSDVKD